MKKITNRAFSVLLLAGLLIVGVTLYLIRYVDQGEDWALYFSRLNSGASGQVLDRNGVLLASFSATENRYAEDQQTRMANYHVTGDYWGRSGTGVLSNFWQNMRSFNHVTGTTKSNSGVLELNINAQINNAAYRALDGRKGAVLVANYRTGELLGMYSGPTVDPAENSGRVPEGAFVNRCLSSVFVPGSVFKLVTAAAAIENLDGIMERSFYCEGSTSFAGVEVTCPFEHYTQSFEEALANSCNVAFSRMAVAMGQETMVRYARAYGLLDGHSLDGLATAAGSFPEDFIGDPELGWSGIGQSTDMVNPFAMLRLVSAIANEGVVCEPRLVRSDRPLVRTRLMEAETARTLAEMLHFNVASYYSQNLSFHGLPVCAKTGTAELGDGTSHAWFVGFLNDEAHPYAFVVLVEQGGGGMSVAAPAAVRVLQTAVRYE